MLGNYFLDNSFENITVLTRFHTARHIPIDDNLKDDLYANDWVIEASELQVLKDLPVTLSMLELLQEQM